MSCSKCKNNNCSGCGGSVSTKSEPPYSCAPLCAEDHTNYVCDEKFVTVVRPSNSWNVPACGATAVLAVGEVDDVHIGSYLWAKEFGYFEIVSFDKVKREITIKNNCASGNADEGTLVTANSTFIISDPPASSVSNQSTLFPYVAVSFTAPNVSSPTLVSVTTVNGLSVGKNVQIGSGSYLLTGVPDGTTIEIENTGTGVTPGTVIEAENSAGDLQYPVTLIDANPCTNDATTSGKLMACANNILTPFNVPYAGAVLVGTDAANNLAEFQLIDVPTRTCSPINDCCLTLVPGTTSYVIPVADSSIFTVGDLIQLGSRSDRFTVTEIIDSDHIRATVDTNPSSVQTVPAGTSACLAGCCELVSAELQGILDEFGGSLTQCSEFQYRNIQYSRAWEQEVLEGTVLPKNGTLSAIMEYTYTNPSTCRDMPVTIIDNQAIQLNVFNGTGDPNNGYQGGGVGDVRLRAITYISYNGAAFQQSQQITNVVTPDAGTARDHTIVVPYIQGDGLDAGETKTFRVRTDLILTGGPSGTFAEVIAWRHGGIPIGIATE